MKLRIPALKELRSGCREIEAVDETGAMVVTFVPMERLLSIRLDDQQVAALTTLGNAPGHLAIGHLRTRHLLASIDEIAAIHFDLNAFSVSLTSQRHPTAGSTTGPQTGVQAAAGPDTHRIGSPDPAATDSPLLRSQARLSEEVIHDVAARVGQDHSEPSLAGAIHTCRLLSNAGPDRGELLACVSDLGTDGALDTLAGLMWADGLAGDDKILHVTGALDSSLVERCVLLGIPFLLSPSIPTLGAIRAAQRLGLTLIGGCLNHRFLAFSGAQRLLRLPATGFA